MSFASDTFVLPLPPGHRFPTAKYARSAGARGAHCTRADACSGGCERHELGRAHDAGYVDAVARGD
jgi:hypothetical protein